MRAFATALAFAASFSSTGAIADPNERAIQRALVGRDQQSAGFNAQLRGQSLDTLHSRQLMQLDNSTAPRLERSQMQREREAQLLRLPPPAAAAPLTRDAPLPLPGGLPHVVDPIPVQGSGG